MDNVSITMTRPDLRDIPQFALPPGFGIRTMQTGESGIWTDVQRAAEPHFAVADDLFETQFGTDETVIGERCFLLTEKNGQAVGTISAWFDNGFRGERNWGRIHWLAVHPEFQGRGLAKAGLTHALTVLAAHHERAYLDTSTARLGALKIYLDFGFVPDLTAENAADAWHLVAARLPHPALEKLK